MSWNQRGESDNRYLDDLIRLADRITEVGQQRLLLGIVRSLYNNLHPRSNMNRRRPHVTPPVASAAQKQLGHLPRGSMGHQATYPSHQVYFLTLSNLVLVTPNVSRRSLIMENPPTQGLASDCYGIKSASRVKDLYRQQK